MPLEVIYVVRHGFRSGWHVDPITGVYSTTVPTPTGIPADPSLTSHGVRQAEELGEHLTTLDPPIDVVYSSPYYRCLQTITPFVDLKRRCLGLDAASDSAPTSVAAVGTIRPEPGISEWFGSAPFEHPQPAPINVLKPMFPAIDESYVPAQTPSRKGETLTQLYERVGAAVRAIIDRCDAEGRRAVVLCSHAAVVIVLGRVLTGKVPAEPDVEDFHAHTCGLSAYKRQGEDAKKEGDVAGSGDSKIPDFALGGWTCEVNSDCSFLSSGAERNWRFVGDESFPGTAEMSQTSEAKL